MDNERKPAWLFGVLFISLAVDVANVFRLVHGPVPFPFFVPWIVAGVATILLAWGKAHNIRAVRIILWIVLSLAVLLLSILSDGTNLSLWVWLGIITGPMSPVLSRRLIAGLFGLAHIITQGFLLPLPPHNAPTSYIIIELTGALGLIAWHQWHRRAVTQGRSL